MGVHRVTEGFDFPLAVNVEPHRGKMPHRPLVWGDHREHIAARHCVEVVGLADDWLELDRCLVDQLIPVKMIDRLEILLADFTEFLL